MSNKIKISVILVLMLFVTGCTEILKNEEGKAVKNEITGQNLTANILCQPENEKIRQIYIENKIDLEEYPKCSEFTVGGGGYEGSIWQTIFVKPLAWLLIQGKQLLNNYGLSIIAITILLRLLVMPITKKVAIQSEAIKKARPDLEKLEKKYKGRNDRETAMLKAQEQLQIYKKHKINPFSGILFALIQIPLFFAFYEAINRTPTIFESSIFGFQLGTTPLKGITNGEFYYILLIVLIVVATYYSFIMNRNSAMNSDQEKQMKIMMYIMIGFISIISFSLPTAIGIYWIFNSGFTILQNYIVRRKKKND